MRRLCIALLVAAALSTAGCEVETDSSLQRSGSPPKWQSHVAEVRRGMGKSEVRALLGAPENKSKLSAKDFTGTTVMEEWSYGDPFDTYLSLSFTDGILDNKFQMTVKSP